MVRRRIAGAAFTVSLSTTLAVVATLACAKDADMRDSVEMTDTMEVMRAMEDEVMRDALLDTMPGGEMARGDSTAEMRLLKTKMER